MTLMKRASWIPVLASSVVLGVALTGCGEESFHDLGPTEIGEIRYDLALDGSPAEGTDPFRIRYSHRTIDASAAEPFTPEFLPRTLDNVAAGSVLVELSRLPRNCSVEDGDRVLEVPEQGTASVTFAVTCT